jgi:DNA-binding transcriptional regulator WhiA
MMRGMLMVLRAQSVRDELEAAKMERDAKNASNR